MRRNSFPAIVLSLLVILACGALGAFAGLSVVRWIGLTGTPSALVAAIVAIVVASVAFAVGAALLRRFTTFR